MKYLGLLALPLLVTGCFFKDFTTVARPQLDEAEPATDQVRTVGNYAAEFDNATDMVVTGYGIVRRLDGTGGPTPPGDARTVIVERLKRAKIENPAEIIDSPDCAIVVVTAVVQPGVRRGEFLDVEVTLPPGSKVKNLRGGVLDPTPLVTFATQGEVRDYLKQNDMGTVSTGNRLLRGHEVVYAAGPIQAALPAAGAEAPAADQPLIRGFVWKGGKTQEGRAMYLVLKADQQRYRVAEQVASRMNEAFQAGESASTKVAVARNKDLVAVAVPPRYRLNRPHFMRVVWALPLAPPTDPAQYVREWEDKLHRPETTLAAAIRLEALGAPGIPALHNALKSEYPLVRFASAEALAYLGRTEAADTLRKSAAEHPALQAYALTALAALDDALGMSRLEELLASPQPELRYGAFRALREIEPGADLIHGEKAGHSFVMHEVATPGPTMIHLLTAGRAEVVLFGETPKLKPPFALTAGANITVTAQAGDKVATISRFSTKAGAAPNHAQCPLAVPDVLRKMAELGANYSDAAEMLTKAEERKALGCRLVRDALPKAVPINRLAEAARLDPRLEQEEALLAETDAAATPGLFAPPAEPGRRD